MRHVGQRVSQTGPPSGTPGYSPSDCLNRLNPVYLVSAKVGSVGACRKLDALVSAR